MYQFNLKLEELTNDGWRGIQWIPPKVLLLIRNDEICALDCKGNVINDFEKQLQKTGN